MWVCTPGTFYPLAVVLCGGARLATITHWLLLCGCARLARFGPLALVQCCAMSMTVAHSFMVVVLAWHLCYHQLDVL